MQKQLESTLMNKKEMMFMMGASMAGGLLVAVIVEALIKPFFDKLKLKKAAKKAALEAKEA